MKLLYFTSLLLAITNLALAASCSKKKVVGYFSEWRNSVYPISKVDLSKLTHINYGNFYIYKFFIKSILIKKKKKKKKKTFAINWKE